MTLTTRYLLDGPCPGRSSGIPALTRRTSPDEMFLVGLSQGSQDLSLFCPAGDPGNEEPHGRQVLLVVDPESFPPGGPKLRLDRPPGPSSGVLIVELQDDSTIPGETPGADGATDICPRTFPEQQCSGKAEVPRLHRPPAWRPQISLRGSMRRSK